MKYLAVDKVKYNNLTKGYIYDYNFLCSLNKNLIPIVYTKHNKEQLRNTLSEFILTNTALYSQCKTNQEKLNYQKNNIYYLPICVITDYLNVRKIPKIHSTLTLDFGCGAGTIGLYLKKYGHSFICDFYDINKYCIQFVLGQLWKHSLYYSHTSISKNLYYDSILAIDSIGYSDREKTIKKLVNISKPIEGKIYIKDDTAPDGFYNKYNNVELLT